MDHLLFFSEQLVISLKADVFCECYAVEQTDEPTSLKGGNKSRTEMVLQTVTIPLVQSKTNQALSPYITVYCILCYQFTQSYYLTQGDNVPEMQISDE